MNVSKYVFDFGAGLVRATHMYRWVINWCKVSKEHLKSFFKNLEEIHSFDLMTVDLVTISKNYIEILQKHKSGENITMHLKSTHYPASTIIDILPVLF